MMVINMKNKHKLTVFLFLLILSSFKAEAITASNQTLYVTRGNNYSVDVTGDTTFAEYTVTKSSADIIIISNTRAGYTITINFLMAESSDYKTAHGLYISTFDGSGYSLENITVYIYITNLTQAEIATLITDLDTEKDTNTNLEAENEGLTSNLTDWANYEPPKSGWEKYGSGVTTAMIAACFAISLMGGVVVIPSVQNYKRQRNTAREETRQEKEQRERSERNKVSSDLFMNPQVQKYDGKMKYYSDLLSPHEYIAVKKLSETLDFGYFATPDKEHTSDNNKLIRKKSTLDMIKKRLNEHATTKNNFLRQKHVLSAILKFMNYKGFINGVGDIKDRDPFPVECNIKDIERFTALIHDKKEEQLGGIPSAETEKYDKLNKDLFEDYERTKQEADSGSDEDKDFHYQSFLDDKTNY